MRVTRSTPPSGASPSVAAAFAQHVLFTPHVNHAAVRLGLWLAGVADRLGTDSVDMFPTNFIFGYKDDTLEIPGVAIRPKTIRDSVKALKESGLLTTSPGALKRVGYSSTKFTFPRQ